MIVDLDRDDWRAQLVELGLHLATAKRKRAAVDAKIAAILRGETPVRTEELPVQTGPPSIWWLSRWRT